VKLSFGLSAQAPQALYGIKEAASRDGRGRDMRGREREKTGRKGEGSWNRATDSETLSVAAEGRRSTKGWGLY